MKCEKCGAEVLASAKFCANCGNQMFSAASKSPDEVEKEWLWTIMARLGYKRDKDKEGETEAFGTHTELGNLSLNVKKDHGVISLQRLFLMNKAKWGKQTEQLGALNKANGAGFMTTWFYNEKNNLLGAYSFVPLMSSIGEPDVINVIEKFNKEVRSGLVNSGLAEFLQ